MNNQHPPETPSNMLRNVLQGLWGHRELREGCDLLSIRVHTLEHWTRQVSKAIVMLEAANDREDPDDAQVPEEPLAVARGCLWGLGFSLVIVVMLMGLWWAYAHHS